MCPSAHGFDNHAFFDTVDTRRREQQLSWPALATVIWEQSRVLNERLNDHPISPNTIRKMADRGGLSCQHALFRLRWLEVPPEQIVRQCAEVGLVQGQHLSVDGSFVEANAAKESRIPREQLVEAAQVNRTVRQYLRELEPHNRVEELVHEQEQVLTTDPDSTYATKGGTPAGLGYYDNYLVDNRSCVIVGVQATAARMSQETVAVQNMIIRLAQWQEHQPSSVVADATYGNGEFLQ